MKMGKNDFDIDFDFEEEYGFDPKAFLGTEDYAENIDLSEFSDEDLGLKAAQETFEEEDSAMSEEENDYTPEEELYEDDFPSMDNEDELPEEYEDDAIDVPDFFDKEDEESYEQEQYEVASYQAEADYEEEDDSEESDMEETMEYSEEEEYDEEAEFDDDELGDEGKKRNPIKLPNIKLPKITLPKLSTPKFVTKFYDLYFAPIMDKSLIEEPQDPNNPRRRRRKTKVQIFKEVYLPPILVCVTAILVMSFVIGAVSNAIADKQLSDKQKENEVQASQDAAALKEQQYQSIMAQVDELAAGYNYQSAIDLLNSFGDASDYPELDTKKAELVTAQQQLIEHREPSLIPNLSFHVLIEDLPRAMADTDDLKGSYNKNFVSTGEFKAILGQLYANGYVLVDFDSFTEVGIDLEGNTKIQMKPVYLPAGKKPIMLTETMVNYFGYMNDGDNDGVADAKGDGFASKLVVDGGKVKAEYVDANGQTLIGDYDLVPILESFIDEHPDFSYQGARATLAVTGYEGVFGYRTNTSYIATKGQAYYDQECANAKEVVNALRNAGYNIACFTYGNVAYRDMSTAQVQADLQSWTQQITPVVGEVDTIVFARISNISDYGTGSTTLNLLKTTGFRYFVSNGSQPWAEVNTTYVRQNRLMVTGQNMAHYRDQFNGIFDCAAVLDVNTRGNVPN